MHESSQSIFMIGSGNLATHLAEALRAAGHRMMGVYSRTEKHAQRLADTLQCPAYTSLKNVPEADVYVFAVKDDALRGLISELVSPPQALLLHTAGSVPKEVFQGKAERHGVLYPLQTFSRERAVCFREIPCFIEASTQEALQALKRLAETVSGRVEVLDSEKRRHLHLSAVFACNFVNHCYDVAWQLLQEQQLNPRVLLPLLDETARKVHNLTPAEAQTGPAVRWDTSVMNRHLSLLGEGSHAGSLYRLMSEGIHAMAEARAAGEPLQGLDASSEKNK